VSTCSYVTTKLQYFASHMLLSDCDTVIRGPGRQKRRDLLWITAVFVQEKWTRTCGNVANVSLKDWTLTLQLQSANGNHQMHNSMWWSAGCGKLDIKFKRKYVTKTINQYNV